MCRWPSGPGPSMQVEGVFRQSLHALLPGSRRAGGYEPRVGGGPDVDRVAGG
jgi:hypothetical protein